MNALKNFNKSGFVLLSNVLEKEECNRLVHHLFNLYDQGLYKKDPQCPLSESFYGDIELDSVLEKLAGPMEKYVGKSLIPTYSYARIYRPGEELKKHKDRDECEISATITLGYDSDVIWPIMFDEKNEYTAELEVGEMAIYKGREVVHWRQPFKGKWHVQLFLHYVDADGPFSDRIFDGREKLGTDKRLSEKTSTRLPDDLDIARYGSVLLPETDNFLPGYYAINSENNAEFMFTKDECEKIIEMTKTQYPVTASVGSGSREGESEVHKKIRSADVYTIKSFEQKNKWIFEKIIRAVSKANNDFYNYDVSGINDVLQLVHYRSDVDIKGHYDWHVDAGGGDCASRKISFTAQLSDPSSYTGCDLIVDNHCNKVQAVREQGSISLFPSYMPHVVTPVETGERYALVIWIHGPRRFK